MIRRAVFLLAVGTLVAAPKVRVPVDANDLNNFAHAYNAFVSEVRTQDEILNAKETETDRIERQQKLWESVVSNWKSLSR